MRPMPRARLPLASLPALAFALALPLAAGATPAVEISCTINAVTKSGTETVSRPKVTTLQGKPATISMSRGEGDGEPAHTLVLELVGGPEGVAGEARVAVGEQPPVSHAIHIAHGGQWQEIHVVGSFKYVIDCRSRGVVPARPDPTPSTPVKPAQ